MEKLFLPIDCYKDVISNNSLFYFFSIDLSKKKQKEYLDKYLVSICEGKDSDSSVDITKTRLKKTFSSKLTKDENDSNWIMGATAELYLHFFMNLLNYKQEFIYRNLEEKSIKKGFDGIYTDVDNDIWVLESKSGSNNTKNISHVGKVREAYKDLSDKFSGNVEKNLIPNDPWENALNHAYRANSIDNIKMKLKKLSDEYVQEVFHRALDFNIIPCGTIFIMASEKCFTTDINSIKESVDRYINDKEYKKLIVICSTQDSYNNFLDYIGVAYEN